jgi:hypothetical protein
MKTKISLVFLFLFNTCYSQEYSDMWEMYKTPYDFMKYKSCYIADFSIKQDFQNNIFYRISSTDSKANTMTKQAAIWGIYKEADSLLFLNGERMGMRKRYVKVREIGKYCYFWGDYVVSIVEQEKAYRSSYMFGLFSSLPASDMFPNKGNVPYIMKLEVGVPHILDQYYLAFILRDYPILAEQFKSEAKPDELETQLKYVRLLNKQ